MVFVTNTQTALGANGGQGGPKFSVNFPTTFLVAILKKWLF